MPTGTGAVQSTNLPSEAFIVSPEQFSEMTSKQEQPIETQEFDASDLTNGAATWTTQIPQVGIVAFERLDECE